MRTRRYKELRINATHRSPHLADDPWPRQRSQTNVTGSWSHGASVVVQQVRAGVCQSGTGCTVDTTEQSYSRSSGRHRSDGTSSSQGVRNFTTSMWLNSGSVDLQ